MDPLRAFLKFPKAEYGGGDKPGAGIFAQFAGPIKKFFEVGFYFAKFATDILGVERNVKSSDSVKSNSFFRCRLHNSVALIRLRRFWQYINRPFQSFLTFERVLIKSAKSFIIGKKVQVVQ